MNPGPAKKKYTGGYMLSDTAWNAFLRDHQRRIERMKPAISIEEPWRGPFRPKNGRAGSRPATARGSSSPARADEQHQTPRRADGASPSSRPQTARSRPGTAKGAKGAPAKGGAKAAAKKEGRRIETLDSEQQYLCEDMVDMLLTLSTDDCKGIVEHLFVLTEERRLLQGYDGVFPALTVEAVEGTGDDEVPEAEEAAEEQRRGGDAGRPKEEAEPAAEAKSRSGDASSAHDPPPPGKPRPGTGRPTSAKQRKPEPNSSGASGRNDKEDAEPQAARSKPSDRKPKSAGEVRRTSSDEYEDSFASDEESQEAPKRPEPPAKNTKKSGRPQR